MTRSFLPFGRAALLALTFTLALAAAPSALAGCSRAIWVPVAPIGASVTVRDGQINGIYPELLRTLGAAAGCEFIFSEVPRARLEAMFEAGQADLLIPASGTPLRDRHGWFIPLLGSRPTLISVAGARAPVTSMHALLARRELRVALVRGYDYGDAYQALAAELNRQGRLFLEVDALSVARLLQSGAADATIMSPTILSGAIEGDARVHGLNQRLRLEPLPELPWGLTGAYISRKSVQPEDLAALRALLEQAARSGALMDGFRRHHGADILAASIRPYRAGR
jgi:polar amino acid transport system substrate-binding protein